MIRFESLSAREWPDPKTTTPHILPIYATSSYDFEDIGQGIDIFSVKETGHTYSRYGNPTAEATAAKIAAMETYGSSMHASAVMTNSGMSAIHVLASGLLRSCDKMLTQPNIYGGTTELFRQMSRSWGIEIVYADLRKTDEVDALLKADPAIKLVYLETPANPTLACIDIEALARVTALHNRWSAIDNTFATPYLQQPLLLGVDFVIHSTTKFLNGHGNSIAGVVIGKDADLFKQTIWNTMKLTGANCSPFEAWLVYQGMKTLPLRMDKHSSNAMLIATTLANHPNVSKVNYPGLESHPDHLVARKQMRAFGGMMSFELNGGLDTAIQAMNKMKFCSLAPTLGDVDTLILHPASSSHLKVDPDVRRNAGITDGLIRISVGIEDPQDILDDLLQAID
jgi:methionine-gamma-lyase